MRMEQAANRDELIRRFAGSVDGIVYHTVQFCDNYAYEYAWLKEWLDRPMPCWKQITPGRAADRYGPGSKHFWSLWPRKYTGRKQQGREI